jgi:hypothetical protein
VAGWRDWSAAELISSFADCALATSRRGESDGNMGLLALLVGDANDRKMATCRWRKLSLGQLPDLSLVAARDLATDARQKFRSGSTQSKIAKPLTNERRHLGKLQTN